MAASRHSRRWIVLTCTAAIVLAWAAGWAAGADRLRDRYPRATAAARDVFVRTLDANNAELSELVGRMPVEYRASMRRLVDTIRERSLVSYEAGWNTVEALYGCERAGLTDVECAELIRSAVAFQ